jgi:uncharacterized protein (DUF433 family)
MESGEHEMAVAATTYRHIILDDRGVPHIEGANTKVVEVVLQVRAHGLSAEELHLELPHLTLGQIHSALAYYWDHKQELDADMQRRRNEADKLRDTLEHPGIVERLRQAKVGSSA